ncbi:hypothetical protein [Leeuwenhoekiella sp. MAR_2009_132]|uniref:hypothetical protein n=1 Tax=Leeuwenhoekiella sp. MAR_2009_132 TaxID=1392489 RepID=UPI00048F501E|nr:hypothetical protein [Leeuwenhoekiella sp. MAR_2009_132]
MNAKLYVSGLFIFCFGGILTAQVNPQIQLIPQDSLFLKFNLNSKDFSYLEFFENHDALTELTKPGLKPNPIKNRMPILKPDETLNYPMRIYKPNPVYEYKIQVLEPIMIDQNYQS